MNILESTLSLGIILWPCFWLYLFFVKGYFPYQIPDAGPFDTEKIAKEKKIAAVWMMVSLLALLVWYIGVPLLVASSSN